MGQAYPQLHEKRDFVKDVIRLEEERFLVTLNEGVKKVADIIKTAQNKGTNAISGEEALCCMILTDFRLTSLRIWPKRINSALTRTALPA
jgi:alanyl-tRNA synthetase